MSEDGTERLLSMLSAIQRSSNVVIHSTTESRLYNADSVKNIIADGAIEIIDINKLACRRASLVPVCSAFVKAPTVVIARVKKQYELIFGYKAQVETARDMPLYLGAEVTPLLHSTSP